MTWWQLYRQAKVLDTRPSGSHDMGSGEAFDLSRHSLVVGVICACLVSALLCLAP